MSKEVVKKDQLTSLAIAESEFSDIANEFNIDSSDILIPKILLMQPTSVFVADGEAVLGDFRNSVTKEKIGTVNEPFEFIPFHFTKTWDIVSVDDAGKYIRKEEFKIGGENLPWEFEEEGKKLKRIKRLDFFGFTPKALERGDILPNILSFRSTGYREGTKILTQFKLNISKKKLPWSNIWTIKGEKKKNENNQSYCVPKIDIAGDTPEETLKVCLDWYKNIKSMASRIKVDDSDVEREVTVDVTNDISETGNF